MTVARVGRFAVEVLTFDPNPRVLVGRFGVEVLQSVDVLAPEPEPTAGNRIGGSGAIRRPPRAVA